MEIEKLKAPFPVDKVSFRIGSRTSDKSKGIGLAYIDARDVMERLDEVCGIGNWQARYPHANGKTCCDLGIKIDGEWVWKSNGAGDTDVEGEKGAFSDAFKRAAVLWGIGRYLYDMPNVWVELEKEGKQFSNAGLNKLRNALKELSAGRKVSVEKDSHVAVRMVSEMNQLTTPPQLRQWWKANEEKILALPAEQQEEVELQWQGRLKEAEEGAASQGPFKWENVAAQDAWVDGTAIPVFKRCDTREELAKRQNAVQFKIDALEAKRRTRLIEAIQERCREIEAAETQTQLQKAG